MAGNKGRSQKAAKKNYYNSYNYEKNRTLRLKRHLNKHPEDVQAQRALGNIHHKGPRPSNDKLGWVDRSETINGFTSDKKDDANHIYYDVSGPHSARQIAQMAAHIRKVERQHRHEMQFGKKAGKKS